MTWIAPDVPLPEKTSTGDDRPILEGFLAWHRALLRHKCAGLTGAQLAECAVPSSNLSLLGLVRHIAQVERQWFLFLGADVDEEIDVRATGARVRLVRDVGNVTMDFDGIETVAVPAKGGNDSVTVGNLAGTVATQIDLDLGAGDDVADASAQTSGTVTFTAHGGDGNDRLIGSPGNDHLFGDAGDDVLIGNGGADELDGGPGTNTVTP